MKKLITTILFVLPFCLFGQTTINKVNTVVNQTKQVITTLPNVINTTLIDSDEELDPEYIENTIVIEPDNTVYKYPNMDAKTDQEQFNYELQQTKFITGKPKGK